MAIEAWLSLLQAAQQITTQAWLDALKRCGSAEALVAAPRRTLLESGLSPDAVAMLDKPDRETAARWRAWLAAPNRKLVTFGSREYPQRLAEIPDAPLALWVEGARLDLLWAPQLAIVGSRSPTADGKETAEQFARYLARRGLTITSGLATGIDGASHRGAVGALGGTLAVLGGGLDAIFPREHTKLAAEIAARGLLVSEYAPGVEPQKLFFPQRNRIIAGLTLGTLVVEATRRSGSLITARLALDYGREVFAIPGSIHNPLARGCHYLIRQGAKLVEEAADVLVELAPLLTAEGFELAPEPIAETAEESPATRDPSYEKLLNVLGFSPTPIADLSSRTSLTTAELSSMLLLLELEGLVEALPGGRYSRRGKKN
ncbi:MAG TPA: DNA-processing protein DprA [Gammaproteobacteria bacterium]|nr:DNA-processing protein DprA [Gammaproteobacteria bacterium]